MRKSGIKIGSNLGSLLLNTAQDKLVEGDIMGMMKIYTTSFDNFSEDLIISLLKNKAVLVKKDDDSMVISKDPEDIKENNPNIYGWQEIIYGKERIMMKLCHDCRYIFSTNLGKFNISKALADSPNKLPFVEAIINKLDNKELDENDEIWKAEHRVWYIIYKYLWLIKNLNKNWCSYTRLYDFLVKHKMISPQKNHADLLEKILDPLRKFILNEINLNYPEIDVIVDNLKSEINSNLSKHKDGQDFIMSGLFPKRIEDKYNSEYVGYLGPFGEYYSALIYPFTSKSFLELATRITKLLGAETVVDPELTLERLGWIKIREKMVYIKQNPTPNQITELNKLGDIFIKYV